MDTDIRDIILSLDYWTDLKRIIDEGLILHVANKVVQGRHANNGDTFYYFNKMLDNFDENEEMKISINKRWNLIKSDTHAACFFADPRYIEEEYDERDLADALDHYEDIFGEEWETKYKAEWLRFRNGEGIYGKMNEKISSKDDSRKAINYWKSLIGGKKVGKMAKAFCTLMSTVTSQASIESTFNILKQTQTAFRASMGTNNIR